jgi:hypothetical protein
MHDPVAKPEPEEPAPIPPSFAAQTKMLEAIQRKYGDRKTSGLTYTRGDQATYDLQLTK